MTGVLGSQVPYPEQIDAAVGVQGPFVNSALTLEAAAAEEDFILDPIFPAKIDRSLVDKAAESLALRAIPLLDTS